MFEHSAETKLRCASICLEDGADEASCDGEPIEISPHGMNFTSHWWFSPGATLAMTIVFLGTRERSRVEGLVVACEPIGKRRWCVTVLFLEPPTELCGQSEPRRQKGSIAG